ncbi:MAG TPA: MOSC domain-containing protein [Longimicrobiaceae bacterium]|nr:MOSC domain-containing protein [Longimicrobiaceae bacterium]
MSAHVHQLSTSPGGVPKLPVPEAMVTLLGLEGDEQKDRRFHGGPRRALCLFSLEEIQRLRAEGHPIRPGSTGENVTVTGLPWEEVRPGVRLALGDEVVVEVTSYTAPCKKISGSFLGGEFVRISQKLHPGGSRVYACVLRTGRLRVGDAVRVLEDAPAGTVG